MMGLRKTILIPQLRYYGGFRQTSRSNHSAITISKAQDMLGLPSSFNSRDLRQAYLKSAKLCHPDLNRHSNRHDFHAVTEAYELLLGQKQEMDPDDDLGITAQEELSYREACEEWLGVSADVVEESKKCPMFRDWLQGTTDAAILWNSFFALHGGMAPMLRTPSALLEGASTQPRKTRRRRR